MEPFVAIVASGSSVSGTVDLTKRALLGVAVPVVTSCDLALQGNLDTTSATFVRLLEARAPGSGDLRFATGAGSRMILVPATLETPPYVRFETLVAQTDNRTLTLLTRPR